MNRFRGGTRRRKLAGGLAAMAALATAGTVLAVTGFRDLGTAHPNYDDIQFAVDKGWFQGYDDGTFRPDRVVSDAHLARVMRRAFPQGATRAELATFLRGGYERLNRAARLPGEGVSLTMAQANWSTGYFQAALYRALLQELGYEVSDPADLELGPSLAYLAMAEGDADFWVNSWYPGHNRWLENELPDGSKVGDHLTVVGEQMPAGGLQGFLITKSFAERYDIATLDDLNDNPAAIRRYDAQDANPGNGVAEIYGCPESWTCDDIIQSQIAFSGWENIDQVLAGYDAMFAEAVAKANKGAPMVAYTWTPSSYITQLRPGDNVVWVGVEDVLDDSNPLGREGGEGWDQRPGTAALSPDSCPDAAERGICQLGWAAADILVTARNDLIRNHPAAASLLANVALNVVDVSLQVVAQEGGESPVDLAEQWIANNQDKVNAWLEKATAAHNRTGEPGEGVSLTMAQANWSTGYFQAALYRDLLQRLGYEVSDPADLELGPSLAYLAMAEGDADFWVNSWYPIHNSWLENELLDGSKVGDHLTVVGEQMPAGGLQGFLITKSFAERYDIATLDDLNDNPAAIRRYDAQDANPGNGVAEIYGCPESWTCDDIIESQIVFSGWDNIDQVTAGYDAMFAEAVTRANLGVPMVAYTWTPSSYITQLRPGDNVVWVGVEDVLDDSNPLDREGGEEWDQRPGTAALRPGSCPDAAERGVCQLGWLAADILVTARNDLLENHPAAAKLLELVELNVVDVSLQVVAQNGGETPQDLATQWIANNQSKVDSWLAVARVAASTSDP